MNQIVESRSFCVFISARKSLMYDFLILRDNMIKMESPYAFAFLAQQPTDFLVILLNVRVAALRALIDSFVFLLEG